MKIISLLFLLFAIFSLSCGKIVRISKNDIRTLSPETVDFQLIYLGSCDKFFSISHISISSRNDLCLPIVNNQLFPDLDDLTAHVLCTNIGKNRAQIDFVEIFQTPYVPLTNGFIISFVSNAPYKANVQGATYLRRPSCTLKNDYCSTNKYVNACSDNLVQFQNGFVISKDLVYIIPYSANSVETVTCGSGMNNCCSYVNSVYCPRTADDSVMKVIFRPSGSNHHNQQPQQHHHEEHHHEEHHHEEHHQEEHHNKDDDRDDDEDDDREEHRHKKDLSTQKANLKHNKPQINNNKPPINNNKPQINEPPKNIKPSNPKKLGKVNNHKKPKPVNVVPPKPSIRPMLNLGAPIPIRPIIELNFPADENDNMEKERDENEEEEKDQPMMEKEEPKQEAPAEAQEIKNETPIEVSVNKVVPPVQEEIQTFIFHTKPKPKKN